MRAVFSSILPRVPVAAAVFCLTAPALAEQPGFGPWASGEEAEVRLIASGIGSDGRLHGGVEILLEPGWWTYWRSPGAAGIPPVIDFGASENLGAVAVSYPLPERHDDGYGATNIYPGGVLLPFSAKVPDPDAPTVLNLSLDLGVCEEICIPEHVEATLTVPVGLRSPVATATLAGASARVPGAPIPGVLAVERARQSGGTEQHPRIDVVVTAPDDAIVFVEGPPNWHARVPERLDGKEPATYRVTVDRFATASTPVAGETLRVTLAGGGKAIEQTVTIDE